MFVKVITNQKIPKHIKGTKNNPHSFINSRQNFILDFSIFGSTMWAIPFLWFPIVIRSKTPPEFTL
jgi:hypothetical protein